MARFHAAEAAPALRGPHGWVAIALVAVLASGVASSPRFRGRPLTEVLEELHRRGLNLIFTSAVVGSDLVVAREPEGDDPRKILEQILPPLGLRAEDGAGGAILVVRAAVPPDEDPIEEATPRPLFIEDIVVTPARHEVSPQDLEGARTVDGADVSLAPVLGGDASRIVTLLPGIASTESSATFYARGSEARDVALVLDGLELYDPYHLSGFQSPFSFVDGHMVESIALVGGGLTADRGDRNGGFIEVSTVVPSGGAKSEIEVGTLNSRFSYQAATPLGPLVVSGRYWYPQAAGNAIVFGDDGFRPTFGDVYLKAGLVATPNTAVSGHALLAADRATLTETDGNEHVDTRSGSASLWVRAIRAWSASLTTETIVSAGQTRRVRTGAADPEDLPVEVDDRRMVRFAGLRTDASWTIAAGSLLRGGIDLRFLKADLEYASGSAAPVVVDSRGASAGLFASLRQAIGAHVTTEVGVRWDRQTYNGDRQWSPRFNVLWRPGTRDEFRAAVGRHAQSVRIHEIRIEDGETAYRPPEIGQQLDLGYRHHFARRWSLRVDAYLHRYPQVGPRHENLFSPVELFPEVESDRVTIIPESARLRGVELSAVGDAGSALTWRAGYTWSSATDDIDGKDVPRSWDQTHAGSALVGYRWASGWFLAVNGVVHTGWPTTPVSGRLVTAPDGSTSIEPVLGERNSARFSIYARVDLKAGRTIVRAAGTLRIEASVVNLTDRDNVCCVDEIGFVSLPGGGIATRTELESWMGITPSLQIAWSF